MKISRNSFLKVMAVTGAAVALTACGKKDVPASTPVDAGSEPAGSEVDAGDEQGEGEENTGRTSADYAEMLKNARPEEDNEYMMIVMRGETEDKPYEAICGDAETWETEDLMQYVNDMMWPLLGFDTEMATEYAVSLGVTNIDCYALAIVKPVEEHAEQVKAAFEEFVEAQRLAFEQYLPDKYEIALAATVTETPTGEILLVCAENGEEIRANLEAALAG